MALEKEFLVHYKESVYPILLKEFAYRTPMQAPRLVKVTLNMGVGDALTDKQLITRAAADLTLIAGQAAVVTYAKKSIAGFKIRQGWPIGCKVTLRSRRMHDFLYRLVHVALPRARDFRGLRVASFDEGGNYSLGIKEHIIFPEIDYDKVDRLRGLDVCIHTSARTKEEALTLLKAYGFPFRRK